MANDTTSNWKEYELSEKQKRDIQFLHWNEAMEGVETTKEQMENWAKRYYASGRDKAFKEFLANEKSEADRSPDAYGRRYEAFLKSMGEL